MLPFIIYWAIILLCLVWAALSLWFTLFYLSRKENGNLWVFAFLNVIFGIILAISLAIYRTWGWGITQYSSFIYLVLGILAGLTLLQAIFGRESKATTLSTN